MSNADTQYFSLLRSALWDEPVSMEGPMDWDAVMLTAKRHANQAL